MVDRIIVLLACMMLALLITLGLIDYRQEYDVLIGIVSLAGFFLAIYNFIRLNK